MMAPPSQGGTGYDNDRAVALLKEKIGAGKTTGDDLFERRLRRGESRVARLAQLLAAFVQIDALVERHVTALEPSHDAFELA